MADKNTPVFMIGIAAELAGVHPQTLRLYERENLVIPKRTAKHTRLYSEADIEILKEIQKLTQALGLNLAGVKMIFEAKKEAQELEATIDAIEKEMDELKNEMEEEIEKVRKSFKEDIVLYKKSAIVQSSGFRVWRKNV